MRKERQFSHCYKVSDDLQEYLEMIFLLTKQHHRWERKENCELCVHIDVSSDRFHELVMRARCEMVEEKHGHSAIYVTKKEYDNTAFVDALARIKDNYVICILSDSEDKDFTDPV